MQIIPQSNLARLTTLKIVLVAAILCLLLISTLSQVRCDAIKVLADATITEPKDTSQQLNNNNDKPASETGNLADPEDDDDSDESDDLHLSPEVSNQANSERAADLDGSASSSSVAAQNDAAMNDASDLEELDSSNLAEGTDSSDGADGPDEPEAEKSQAEKEREAAEASEADEANRQALDEQQAQQREIIMAQAQNEAQAVKDQQRQLSKQHEMLMRRQNAHLNDQLEWRRPEEASAQLSGSPRGRQQASHHQGRPQMSENHRRPSEAIHFSDDQPDLSESSAGRAQDSRAQSFKANQNQGDEQGDLDTRASELDPLLISAQHHYGSHYGSLQKHHGKYYMFAESHKKGQYKAGFKRGNHKFKISGHSSQHGSHADGHVKWHAKKGKGSHHWDYKHKDKKHHKHHY